MSSSKAIIQGQSSLEVQAFINSIFDQYRNADITLARKLAGLNLHNRLQLDDHASESRTEKPAEPHARLSGFNSVVTFDESDGQVHVPIPLHHAEDWDPSNSSRIRRLLESSVPWQVQLDAPFKCRLCRQIVTLRGQEAWMIHIYADLRAYICIHPECTDSFKYYHLWVEHLLTEHFPNLKRYCVRCDAEIIGTRGKDGISTRNAVVEHLVYNHWNELDDADRTDATLNPGKFINAPFTNFPCGICRRSHWKTWYGFAAHVARHLEEISLAALRDSSYPSNGVRANKTEKLKSRYWKKALQDNPKEQGDATRSRRDERQAKALEEKAEYDGSIQEEQDYVNVELDEIPNTPSPTVKKPHRSSLRPRKVRGSDIVRMEGDREEQSQHIEVPGGKLVISGDKEVRVKVKGKDRSRKDKKRDESPPKAKSSRHKQYTDGEVVEQNPPDSTYAQYHAYQFQHEQQNPAGQTYESYRYHPTAPFPNYYMNNYTQFRNAYDNRFAYHGNGNAQEEHPFSGPATQCGCRACAMQHEDYA